jgi:hypothetical protein
MGKDTLIGESPVDPPISIPEISLNSDLVDVKSLCTPMELVFQF